MKASRNDPCPCGSGKKYKKCCLNNQTSETALIPDERLIKEFSAFKHIETTADAISNVFSEYHFADVVSAVFCLNSWRRNRSALAQALSLNWGLIKATGDGTKRIQNYEQFVDFYNRIKVFTPITSYEDYVIDDYGEVFICFEGKQYPVITGTGHQQVYAALRFLCQLALIVDKEKELINLFEYTQMIIEYTKNANLPNTNNEIVFELPNKEYWQSVVCLFEEEFSLLVENSASCFIDGSDLIEKQHFVVKDNTVYPLFNTSILLDYYSILLKNADSETSKRHIEITICALLENTYNFDESHGPYIMIKPCILESENKKIVWKNDLMFAIRNKHKLIIAILLEDVFDNSTVEENTARIEEIRKTQQLLIAEGYRRKGMSGYCGLEIDNSVEIDYIIIQPITDPTTCSSILVEKDRGFVCSALDIIYLFGFADGISEVLDFINYDVNEEAQVFSYGGASNLFFTWKDSHHQIAPGAIEYAFIHTDYKETEAYVYGQFKEIEDNYPRNGDELFSDPLNWLIHPKKYGYNKITHKGSRSFGGHIKQLGLGTYLFLAQNVGFYNKEDFEENNEALLLVVEELNQKLFERYRSDLSRLSILAGKTLELLFMPWNYAKKYHGNSFLQDGSRRLVWGDEYVEEGRVTIRYTVTPELLLEIQNALDRKIETDYILELIKPIEKYNEEEFKKLSEIIRMDSCKPKTVGVFTIKQEYYYSSISSDTHIAEEDYVRVRKEIAKVCMDSGIEPGDYYGREATSTIRKMQIAVVKVFEDYLSRVEKTQLHELALNYLAIQQHGTNINMKRYQTFRDLDPEVQIEFEEETRSVREKYKRNTGTAEYLLESNLAIEHVSQPCECSNSEFAFLLAFADWLAVLQENADLCYHNDQDTYISIDEEYRVDTLRVNEDPNKERLYVKRKYENIDYALKGDVIDEQFIGRAKDAFEKDTRINLGVFIDFLEYLQLQAIDHAESVLLRPNVFRIETSMLISAYIAEFNENAPRYEDVERIVQYLTIDERGLKTVNGCSHEILPVWEREKRSNRYNAKPIIRVDECCVYSPVSIHTTLSMWKNGITNWYLPYEIGMDNLKKVIDEWKKRYEDEMVQDIVKLFEAAEFDLVIPELDFYKRFPKEDYPEVLGDYDVVAFHKVRRELWIVESKVLQKVGSIYEDQMQQKSFFRQHKDDERFQRRIDYMQNNLAKMLKSLGIEEVECNLVPYMVTNKVFASRYKQVQFPIITYHELKEEIKKAGRE